jgi:hypothetical protein
MVVSYVKFDQNVSESSKEMCKSTYATKKVPFNINWKKIKLLHN